MNHRACIDSARCAKWLVRFAACLTVVASATVALADIPPPEPSTLWGHHQAPDAMHVLIGGACISAAVVLAGLIAAWQLGPKSPAGKRSLAAFAILLVVAAVLTIGLPLRIQWENAQWQDWDRRDSVRRSRGGDRWPDFGKERGAGGAEGTDSRKPN